MANLIVKITHSSEIRRFTATSDTLTWAHLSKRCSEMFNIPKSYKLTYVDDEGDRITLSTDEELDEAKSMAFATAPAVLRLSVAVSPVASESKGSSCDVTMSDASTEPAIKTTADAGTHAKPATADAATHGHGCAATADAGTNCNHTASAGTSTRSTSTDGASPPVPGELSSLFNSLARELPTLVEQLPESVRAFLPRAELDLAATLAATRAAAAASAAAGAAAAAANVTDNTNHHPAATTPAGAAPDVPMPEGFPPMAGCHPGVRCDRTGECPIRGNRYNLVGHNYDLCESEFLKLTEPEKPLYVKIPPPVPPSVHTFTTSADGATTNGAAAGDGPNNVDPYATGLHPGVECDRSGMCPIVGVRYNLKGHNYDLCQSEFDKLPAAEKLMYTPIPPVCHRGRPGSHRPAGFAGGAFGGGFGRHGWGGWGGGGGGCGGGGGWTAPHGWGGPPHANRGPPMCGGTGMGGNGNSNGNRLAARFVRDVSIFDGTQMAPSTCFTKIWRIKNSGELPWPPGTRMLFVGGDQMTTEMSVPLSRATPVLPGEEVDVDVEMVAPAEHGRYLGYWRLMGPRGRKFGQRVWCHVQVVDPAVALDVTDQSLADAAAELAKKKASLTAAEPDADADEHDNDPAEAAAAPMTDAAAAPVPMSESELAAAAGKMVDDAILNAVGTLAEAKAAPPTAAEPLATAAGDDAAKAKDAMGMSLATSAGSPIPASASADGNLSDSSDAILVEKSEAVDPGTVEGVAAALGAMGFTDAALIEVALSKHGPDLDACASDLAQASEWDSLLDDLAEMGFENRDLNKALMLRHDGNLKRTVKSLVEDA